MSTEALPGYDDIVGEMTLLVRAEGRLEEWFSAFREFGSGLMWFLADVGGKDGDCQSARG